MVQAESTNRSRHINEEVTGVINGVSDVTILTLVSVSCLAQGRKEKPLSRFLLHAVILYDEIVNTIRHRVPV